MTITDDKIQLAVQTLKEVAQKYPRAYGFAHADNNTHPEKLDFIILAARVLNKLDPKFGMNGKRGNASDPSSDVIDYGVGRDVVIADVIQRAGAHNGDIGLIGWGDVTSFGPGIFIDPFTVDTEFDYSKGGGGLEPKPLPKVEPKPKPVVLPSRDEALDELIHLHNFYKSDLLRPEGLWLGNKPDFLGIAAWYLDTYQNARLNGKTREEARALYEKQIKESEEYQRKH